MPSTWSASNPVVIGGATKKSDFDTVYDNTQHLKNDDTVIAGVKTLSSAPILSTLTGILKGNGASTVTVAAAGTDYAAATGLLGSSGNNTVRKASFSIIRDTSGANGLKCQAQTTSGRGFNVSANIDTTLSAIFTAGGAEVTVGAGATLTGYSLNAGGTALTINLVEAVSNILSAEIWYNDTGADATLEVDVSGNNIVVYALNSTTGAAIDMRTWANTKALAINIAYIVGGAA